MFRSLITRRIKIRRSITKRLLETGALSSSHTNNFIMETINSKKKGNNRHWKNFVDKNYLGSHNLEPGEQFLLTIAKFEGEEEVTGTDGTKKPMMVLYFKENVPKLILNKTNADMISTLYGKHPVDWIGKQIYIHAAQVKSFGKMQDALRVRDVKPIINIDIEKWIVLLDTAKTKLELKAFWDKLPKSAQQNKQVEKHKDELKLKLQ